MAVAFALVWTLFTAACTRQSPDPTAGSILMEDAWISMPDGIRLSATLFLPEGAQRGGRFPVLLEYLPYRKDEVLNEAFALSSYFVRSGYAVARVDIRGTGRSEGRLVAHEYTEQEHQDAEAVIAWLARQPWSSGKVGMFGLSWGGFNSIQMAMHAPPALAAVLAVEATDDLYQDDVHYIDGILHVDSFEFGQDLYNMLPAPPDYVLDDDYFRDRFDTPPWLLVYKRQQRDGAFWDRASLASDYTRMKLPSLLIGGWYDGYRDSVPRMLEHVDAPVKAILGPWAHAYPHDAYPQPGIEWRHEAVRFFDYWLKGTENGVMDEPRLAVYVREWHPPDTGLEHAPGHWRWEAGWPIARTKPRTLYLQPDHSLSATLPGAPAAHPLVYRPATGLEAGGPVMWWGDMPPDQRPTDAQSLVYDSLPFEAATEILGFPQVILQASASAPRANWYVRLSDVAPDGQVTQVTGAGLNGAHLDSATRPSALEPDRVYTLPIELHFTSWVFPEHHRVRLSISNAQWPMFWPTPDRVTTTLHLGLEHPTQLVLPVVPEGGLGAPNFASPASNPELAGYGKDEFLPLTGDEGSPSPPDTSQSGYAEIVALERDRERGLARVRAETGSEALHLPWGRRDYRESMVHEVQENDPARASVRGEAAYRYWLEGRELEFENSLEFRSDPENFYYRYTRRVKEDGEPVKEKTWEEVVPRDFQ
jgi:predicted acyl esterase